MIITYESKESKYGTDIVNPKNANKAENNLDQVGSLLAAGFLGSTGHEGHFIESLAFANSLNILCEAYKPASVFMITRRYSIS